MKIKEIISKTPEMTEEKLLEFIKNNIKLIKKDLYHRVKYLHRDLSIEEAFLKEYDLIQDKQSYLTRGQRSVVAGFVGLCMIQMAKANEPDGGNH